ncbi:MAG TPA: Gfo/Idh/MocA family oxidoreductase [Pyrinomonadaceae bacterium]|nr:Gfo/Idh/MocA family oxidoreductase [Pyrinomonadaceae bacterium]
MALRRLKVGVLGCGRVARLVHLPALARLPCVEVCAVADCDPEAREAAARHARGASAHASTGELLERSGADAVIICLPSALHAGATISALEAGKHVYLEKPIATSLEDGRSVVAAWRRSGMVGMVGFNFRLSRLYAAARRHIQAGALGEIIGARTVSANRGELPGWKRSRATGGGVLLDLGSHHFDLARFLFGREVARVSARTRSVASEADTASVQFELDGGLTVQSFFSSCAPAEDRFEVFGTAGRLSVDRHLSLISLEGAGDAAPTRARKAAALAHSLARSPHGFSKTLRPAAEPSYREALACFVRAAREGGQARPDFADGFHSLASVLAAEESAAAGDGRWVAPARLDDEDTAG